MFTAREIELVKCSLFECIWKVFNNYNDNTSDDDDRHIPSVARMSDTVLSTLRVSSHLIAILGDESLDSFGCKSQKPDSNRLEDKAFFFFFGSCNWLSGSRVGCRQGFVRGLAPFSFLSVLPSAALPVHQRHVTL